MTNTQQLKRARIICAALDIDGTAVIPVPINQLPMDLYNSLLKTRPGYLDVTKVVTGFITSHGRFVTDKEARIIAIEAGQVDSTKNKETLCVTDLFTFNFYQGKSHTATIRSEF